MMYTLRFDVETLIIATKRYSKGLLQRLRFDVETLIIATYLHLWKHSNRCGLM